MDVPNTYRTSIVETSQFCKTSRLTMGAVEQSEDPESCSSSGSCDIDEQPREAQSYPAGMDLKERYLSCASSLGQLGADRDMHPHASVVLSPIQAFKTFDSLRVQPRGSKLARFKTDLRIDVAKIEEQYEEMRQEQQLMEQGFENEIQAGSIPGSSRQNLAEQTLNLSKNLNQLLSNTIEGDQLNESLVKFQLKLNELLKTNRNSRELLN